MTTKIVQIDIFEFVENIPEVEVKKEVIPKPKKNFKQFTIFDELKLLDEMERAKEPVAPVEYEPLDSQFARFKETLFSLTANEGFSWYHDGLPVANFFPIKYERGKEKKYGLEQIDIEVMNRKTAIIYEFLEHIGLEHYKKNPKSMGNFKHDFGRWVKTNGILDLIAKEVVKLSTYEEVDNYFKTYFIFDGVTHSKLPNIYRLTPCQFALVCMAQATDVKDVKALLHTSGYVLGGYNPNEKNIYVLPEGETLDSVYYAKLKQKDIDEIEAYYMSFANRYTHEYEKYIQTIADFKKRWQKAKGDF